MNRITCLTPNEPQAGRTVLVADDNRHILNAMVRVLRRAGFNALGAQDGLEAIRYIASDAGVALLVTDIGMPVMNGLDLAVAVEKHAPDIPILFVSGLVESIAVHSIVYRNPAAILMKPFTPGMFLSRVNELLKGPSDRPGNREALAHTS